MMMMDIGSLAAWEIRGRDRKGWVNGRKTEGQRRNGRQKDGDTQRNTRKGGGGGTRTLGSHFTLAGLGWGLGQQP